MLVFPHAARAVRDAHVHVVVRHVCAVMVLVAKVTDARSGVESVFTRKTTWPGLKSHSVDHGRATAHALRLRVVCIDRVIVIRVLCDGVDVYMYDWRC